MRYTAYLFLSVNTRNGKEEKTFNIFSEDCPSVADQFMRHNLLLKESGESYMDARNKLVSKIMNDLKMVDFKL